MIIKKSPAEIDKMAAAGAILVKTMDLLAGKIRPGVTTGELDAIFARWTNTTPGWSAIPSASTSEIGNCSLNEDSAKMSNRPI